MDELSAGTLRKVVVATDFSPAGDAAVAWGIDLAATHRAMLWLLHVVPWPAGEGLGETWGELRTTEIREARERLDRRAAAARSRGVTVVAAVDQGEASTAILDVSRRTEAELVVIGAHSRWRLTHLLVGSTAHALIKESPVPVLAVHEEDAAPGVRPLSLLAGTDFSAVSRHNIQQAVRMLIHREPVVMMHVVAPTPMVSEMPQPVELTAAIDETSQRAAADQLRIEVDALGMVGIRARDVVRIGLGSELLAAQAAENESDVIVVGARGKSGLVRLLLGSTTKRLLQAAPCPVLVMPGSPKAKRRIRVPEARVASAEASLGPGRDIGKYLFPTQARDDLRVRLSLAKAEVEGGWAELEDAWRDSETRLATVEDGERAWCEVAEAVRLALAELRQASEMLRSRD